MSSPSVLFSALFVATVTLTLPNLFTARRLIPLNLPLGLQELIKLCLQLDPLKRPSAEDLLALLPRLKLARPKESVLGSPRRASMIGVEAPRNGNRRLVMAEMSSELMQRLNAAKNPRVDSCLGRSSISNLLPAAAAVKGTTAAYEDQRAQWDSAERNAGVAPDTGSTAAASARNLPLKIPTKVVCGKSYGAETAEENVDADERANEGRLPPCTQTPPHRLTYSGVDGQDAMVMQHRPFNAEAVDNSATVRLVSRGGEGSSNRSLRSQSTVILPNASGSTGFGRKKNLSVMIGQQPGDIEAKDSPNSSYDTPGAPGADNKNRQLAKGVDSPSFPTLAATSFASSKTPAIATPAAPRFSPTKHSGLRAKRASFLLPSDRHCLSGPLTSHQSVDEEEEKEDEEDSLVRAGSLISNGPGRGSGLRGSAAMDVKQPQQAAKAAAPNFSRLSDNVSKGRHLSQPISLGRAAPSAFAGASAAGMQLQPSGAATLDLQSQRSIGNGAGGTRFSRLVSMGSSRNSPSVVDPGDGEGLMDPAAAKR